ncbi:hypothetical protein LL033_22375 [Clostridium estertheticum]|uniref:hypothetical protein n=1 Tax=Clostridium estertheticum TaxID=238834 RepID=UPI00209AA989|nr:hypothetical protein [Clostridium estertheticum]WAG55318.1 hypothetical protein LL033_22375 [Clostridium estertheticum]
MDSVYVSCPEFENKRFNLRFISIDDCDSLLKVYSDKKQFPYLIAIIVAEMIFTIIHVKE